METRANYFIIGVFVLGVIGAILGFIYWIKNDASGPAGKNYYVLFDGSVQGLTEASPVLFNGIRFGAVDSIALVPEDSRKVRVLISVRAETPVRTNSRARISQQGLAGFIAMEITPGTPDAPLLQAKPNEKYPVIFADTGGGGMLAGVSDAAGQATSLLAHLNTIVSNNEDSLRHTLTNIDALTSSVAEHRDDIAAVITDIRTLSSKLNQIAVKFDSAMDKLAGTSPGDSEAIVSQVQQAVISFRQLADKLDKSLGDKSGELTLQAERSLREFELLMKDTRRLAEALDRVVEKVERNPTGFLLGGQQSPKY
jgi:phospholipid/cholesterol/gamma-HCH transport system substrate-binding protein